MDDKENSKSYWLDDPAQHIKVACHLCGEVWKFPLAYKQSFDEMIAEGRQWKCPYCVRGYK